MVRMTFLGATGTVTGSKTLIETDRSKILVDAGLFQGLKALRERNWSPLPFEPAELDAIILTHAHVDHSGYLPVLVKKGFSGPIYCSHGTDDLARVLLPDAGHLQEEAARFANKHGFSRHSPALPLYTRDEAVSALTGLEPLDWDEERVIGDVVFSLAPVGHIIGASSVHLDTPSGRLVFSGDVGRPTDPVHFPPRPIPKADWLVLESTYGDRRHARVDVLDELAEVINLTAERDGVVLIPAFAVGRTQMVLHLIDKLRRSGRIPELPIYMDSPMALTATEIFYAHEPEHKLTPQDCHDMAEGVTLARTPVQSKNIDTLSGPMIVISASGMATGGRVLHHLKAFASDARNTILLVGYQAAGTRGEALLSGVDELKIHGAYVPIDASVVQIKGLSAHADYLELLGWLEHLGGEPRQVFVVHGEPAASDALRRRLSDHLGWNVSVPELGQQVRL